MTHVVVGCTRYDSLVVFRGERPCASLFHSRTILAVLLRSNTLVSIKRKCTLIFEIRRVGAALPAPWPRLPRIELFPVVHVRDSVTKAFPISNASRVYGVLPLNQLALQPTLTIPHQRRNGPPFHPTLSSFAREMGDYLFGRSLTHRRRGHIDFALNRRCREYRPCGSAVLHTILLPCAHGFDISSCGCAAALPADFHANSFEKVQGTNQGTNVPSRSSPGLVSHARTRARGGIPLTNR